MARQKKSVRFNKLIIAHMERKAKQLERSFSYVVEFACREMLRNELPPNFDPGKDEGDDDEL